MNVAKVLFAVLLCLFLSLPAYAQSRARFFDQPASVLLPENYNPKRAYPLIIFLPQANSAAEFNFQHFSDNMPTNQFIVLIPAGTPQNSDYLPDFSLFVKWYEERLLKDIASTRQQYSVDSKRIILTGHSLGGDLCCALNARNPGLFAGFIASGTRCSYPINKSGLNSLKNSGFHGTFYIGDQDQEARITGIKASYNLFRKNGIETSFELIPKHGHSYIPNNFFMKSLDWILDRQHQPVSPGSAKMGSPQQQKSY